MTLEIISRSIFTKVGDKTVIKLAIPGSGDGLARDYAKGPVSKFASCNISIIFL